MQLVAGLFFLYIEAVVAAVKFHPAVIQLHNALDNAIQKIAVMRYGEHGALVMVDIILQPFDGLHVQMVGRLVQQQDIGFAQDHHRQADAGLFASGKRGEGLAALGGGDMQAVGHLGQTGFAAVAAQHVKARMQRVIAAQQGFGVLARVHLALNLLDFRADGLHLGKGHAQHILHQRALGGLGQLGDVAHPPSLGDGDKALIGCDFAGDDLQQRGFARAVGAKQAHALARVYLKGYVVEHHAILHKGFFNAGYNDFSHDFPRKQ